MRVIVQRSLAASCTVDGNITGQIDKGFMLLIGFNQNDTIDVLPKVLKKVVGLRIFSDEDGKMNKSLKDIGGSILAISQFTLYADCKHGNRPSFTEALGYQMANDLYLEFCQMLKKEGINVQMGVFGGDMQIAFTNDGPVTIIIDSDNL